MSAHVRTRCAAIAAVLLAAAGCASSGVAMRPSESAQGAPSPDPRAEIDRLRVRIERRRDELGLGAREATRRTDESTAPPLAAPAPPGAAGGAAPPSASAAEPAATKPETGGSSREQAEPTTRRSRRCQRAAEAASEICEAALRICRLAEQIAEPDAKASCHAAERDCFEGRRAAEACR